MVELGTLLRESRVEQGLTIEAVADRTKIRAQFLVALEEGRLEELPGQVYARAFLRTYARTLGLEPEKVMWQYEALFSPTQEEELASIRARRVQARDRKRVKYIVGLGVVVLLGVVIYVLYRFLLP